MLTLYLLLLHTVYLPSSSPTSLSLPLLSLSPCPLCVHVCSRSWFRALHKAHDKDFWQYLCQHVFRGIELFIHHEVHMILLVFLSMFLTLATHIHVRCFSPSSISILLPCPGVLVCRQRKRPKCVRCLKKRFNEKES